MAVTAQRRLETSTTRRFGSGRDPFAIPDLTRIQTESYARFLQYDTPLDKRKDEGLEGVLREIFPIESYDKKLALAYIRYELGKPRYEPDECRQLRLTYGRPFRIWLRLNKEQPIEEEVYLGDLPIMLGGGEFIINGAERVVVSQLHRSPGIDFVSEVEAGERRMHSCRVIPERGSWIEINTTKKDSITVRIDQSGKFSVMTLLRAMDPRYGLDGDMLRTFYPTTKQKVVDGRSAAKIEDKYAVDDIVYPVGSERAGEIIVESGQKISKTAAELVANSGVKMVEVMDTPATLLLLNALADDNTASHEEALLRIYQRLRPGNPPQLEKARALFHEKFYDTNRYRLGRVGRFRINRKLGLDVPEDEMVLRPEDLINAVKYVLQLATGEGNAAVDDIDHLGNRRLRTIDELACDEMRKGFLKLRRTVQERMSLKDIEDMTPRSLINPKSISAAIEYFFGRGELSQVVDQTNPLSMLTHERRLSALGPGGLNRKRAGFEVRDVHISHYGRICPIETPEGTNIGLISSLAMYAAVDEYGFLITPYRKVKNSKLTDEVVWLRADEEASAIVASADAPIEGDKIQGETLVARQHADFVLGANRQDRIHRRDAQPDDRRLGRSDSVPGARRCQPGTDGLEHAAASRAAVDHRAADRRDRPGARRRAPLRHDRPRRPQGNGHVRRRRTDRDRPRDPQAAKVRRPQRADLPEPEADRAGRRQGREGPGHRRRRGHLPRRAGAGPQRARRVHVLGRIQLRGRDHHQRRAGQERHLHVDPHRRVRRRNPRDEAWPRGVHARHPQRQRKDVAEPRRERHRADRHVRQSGRHSGRQGLAQEQDRADAGRKTAARDLRPGGRRREK